MTETDNLVRWWELPRVAGRQGDVVYAKGSLDRIWCPKCKSTYIVYNGNYFCDYYEEGCDWALSHPARSKQDREICNLIGIEYQ